MQVRSEEFADQGMIRAVHVASFPTSGEASLVDALRVAGNLSISLVAVDERGVGVGHVAFSPVGVAGATAGVGMAPVAVLAECRCQGIAAELIRRGLALCQEAGHGFVVVLGDPAYYSRFGFAPAADWNLVDEYGGGAAFQAIEFKPGSIPATGGVVRYAPEFAALGD